MKLTKNKDKYLLELNKFELDSIAFIAGKIGGTSKVRNVFSNTNESFWEVYEEKLGRIDSRNLSEKLNIQFNHNDTIFPRELPPKIEKKNCSFFYPKSAYRNENTNNIEHFEPRTLKDAYIEGDYLIGIDKTIKKFSLNKVKHLTWE